MRVTVNNVEIELDIQKDTYIPEDAASLSKEACRTPGIIARYGEVLADLRGATERASFTLNEVSSFVADSARKSATERLTADRLKEIVTLDSKVKDAKNSYIQAMRDMHAVDNTLKALHKKADIVTTLLYQHRQEMKLYGQL